MTFAPGRANKADGSRVKRSYPIVAGYVDMVDGGQFSYPGTIGIASTPDVMLKNKVHLLNSNTLKAVRTVISDDNGSYVFANVRKGPWLILSQDPSKTYNAVVADCIGEN